MTSSNPRFYNSYSTCHASSSAIAFFSASVSSSFSTTSTSTCSTSAYMSPSEAAVSVGRRGGLADSFPFHTCSFPAPFNSAFALAADAAFASALAFAFSSLLALSSPPLSLKALERRASFGVLDKYQSISTAPPSSSFSFCRLASSSLAVFTLSIITQSVY